MPFGEMSPICLIQWVHRWGTLGRVVGTTECMAAATPGFTWSRARVQVSCDTGTGSGGSLEQSGEANRDVEIASKGQPGRDRDLEIGDHPFASYKSWLAVMTPNNAKGSGNTSTPEICGGPAYS